MTESELQEIEQTYSYDLDMRAYYITKLIAEIRRLKQSPSEEEKSLAGTDYCEEYVKSVNGNYDPDIWISKKNAFMAGIAWRELYPDQQTKERG